jgi:CubicO group peptidase (beta-lactamase class C family)
MAVSIAAAILHEMATDTVESAYPGGYTLRRNPRMATMDTRTARVALALMVWIIAGWTMAGANDSAPKASTIDAIFQDLSKPGSPGCALGVYRDSANVYAKGYGLANVEENVAISPQTVFDVGSMSKQFTAMSILLLQKKGKLSLSDDIRKYIPELPDYGHRITILNLLNHTSGLRDYLSLMELAGVNTDSVTTDEDALALIARQKSLNFAPGSEWLYSNTGFFLLSVIVKRVSGETLRDFATNSIFRPVGMTHTEYRQDHTSLIANRALAYDPKPDKNGYVLDISYFEQTGDGAVHTSVEDLARWDENFYTAGVGGADVIRDLQQTAVLSDGKAVTYAKGLVVSEYRGLRTVSHSGSWGGYRGQLLRFPDQHFSVACLCNVGNANPSKRVVQVADLYLAGVMKKPGQPADAEGQSDEDVPKSKALFTVPHSQLEQFPGDYWSEELGVTYRLALAGDSLKLAAMLDSSGLPRFSNFASPGLQLSKIDEFTLGSEGSTLIFQRDLNSHVTGFIVNAEGSTGIRFVRRK